MRRLELPVISPLSDGFARRIRYLRVSLTDRCNYRCTYCMPEEGIEFRPRADILRFEEIERLLGIFAGLGVRRVRLTGGEPTVRADVVELVARVAAIDGIESVVMTSNGHRFPELAQPLARAGLQEVNISLDTLDPAKFRAITRRGDLDRVIAGMDAALAAGLRVKLNAVALRGFNDSEVVDICRFAWARGIVPRFIEHMPMSGGQLYEAAQQLTAAEIRRTVETRLGGVLVPDSVKDQPNGPANGPASGQPNGQPDGQPDGQPNGQITSQIDSGTHGPSRYWRLVDAAPGHQAAGPRRLGIISAMSEHFCDTCNRLRLSATGALHPCLAYDDATSLRDIIRAGGSDDEVRRAILGAVAGKREGHQFQSTGGGAPTKHMIAIGG